MTQETRCPACGAPLVFSGHQDVIRCTFCGTDLQISEADGQSRFRVLSQPEPQKEILDQPVEGAGIPPGAAQVFPSSPPAVTDYEEPLSFQPVSGGAMAYPVSEEQVAKRGVSRWVWIAIALLVSLTFLCACAVLSVLAIFPGRVQ